MLVLVNSPLTFHCPCIRRTQIVTWKMSWRNQWNLLIWSLHSQWWKPALHKKLRNMHRDMCLHFMSVSSFFLLVLVWIRFHQLQLKNIRILIALSWSQSKMLLLIQLATQQVLLNSVDMLLIASIVQILAISTEQLSILIILWYCVEGIWVHFMVVCVMNTWFVLQIQWLDSWRKIVMAKSGLTKTLWL